MPLIPRQRRAGGRYAHQPGTNTWTSTGSMTTPREGQTATLLPDGQVLMAGGTNFDHPHAAIFLASAELYTP